MDPLVKLAKNAITGYIKNGRKTILPADLPGEYLKKKAGVFVTIYKGPQKELRGCIGTFQPTKENIGHEVIDNAITAATEDYRFGPLHASELAALHFEVSILSNPEKVAIINKPQDIDILHKAGRLDAQKFGVIVSSATGHRGLLLPDIAEVKTPAEQVSIARQKGGISNQESFTLWRFTVEKHK